MPNNASVTPDQKAKDVQHEIKVPHKLMSEDVVDFSEICQKTLNKVQANHHIVFDTSDLTQISTSGMQLLVVFVSFFEWIGATVHFPAPSAHIRKIVEEMGLEAWLEERGAKDA